MRYADGSDLVARYDARFIASCVRDDDLSVSVDEVPTNAVVLAALDDASGQFETTLVAAERYTVAELAGLTGNSLALRKRIICDIAMSLILQRRASRDPDKAEAQAKLAERHLENLRKGQIVFTLDRQQDAGLLAGPEFSSYDYATSNNLRDRVKNYFPPRRFAGTN